MLATEPRLPLGCPHWPSRRGLPWPANACPLAGCVVTEGPCLTKGEHHHHLYYYTAIITTTTYYLRYHLKYLHRSPSSQPPLILPPSRQFSFFFLSTLVK
ncbi:hypothetical protein Dda_3531 [Drechslerella dactyloides]|uniref:Uncharacterized protein n=1 Tax=Drechslerella dactyloides TaxID=74499 RepID=A0AAD6IY53_DREDA|nr:hypothetical protein Dda_3531 [Drechslerella dactyloides]